MQSPHVAQFSNFEDISLAQSAVSDDSDGDSFRYSNISTPTLTSDASSLRSSLSSFSSPTLANGQFGSAALGASLPHGARAAEHRKLSLPDNTSMASLSRIPVSQRRSHKQRESEYAQDTDDFWPTDALMFNVPMSPALCAQEKRPQRKPKKLPSIKERDHEILDSDTRDIQLKYASTSNLPDHHYSLPAPPKKRDSTGEKSPRRSLTRPDHLPPKSEDEERRHMSEFKRLVAHAKEQEKVRHEEAKTRDKRRSMQREQDEAQWAKHLRKGTKIDRALWWRGCPEKFRGVAWQNALNPTTIVPMCRADKQLSPHCANVFPCCGLFEYGRPLHDSILEVVASVASLRQIPANKRHHLLYPAAVLMLSMDEQNAANCLAQLMPSGGLVHAVLTGNEGLAQAHYTSYYKVFRAKFGRLYSHFTSIRLAPHQYLDSLMSSFMLHLLSIDTACRLMDLLVSEGESFLLRTALGIVRVHEAALYQSRDLVIAQLESPINTPEDELVDVIKSISR